MIPSTLEELTPEWLTRVLRERGVLREARVARVESEVLGEGEGFIGLIVRLRLELEPDEAGAPRSVIAKLPTPVLENRAAGEGLGTYEREIRFYEELGGSAPARTPRCYYADLDEQPGARFTPQFLRMVEWLPLWLIGLVVGLLRWLAGKSSRRYVMLLEDLAPGRIGDQVGGCSREEAREALRTLAHHHADWWESPRIENLYWITDLDIAPRSMLVLYRQGRPGFERLYGERLSARMRELCNWLDQNGEAVLHRLGRRPHTLIHGDYRLDNLCFDPASGVRVFDWQIAARGRAGYDAGYFVCSTFGKELGPDPELELVREYWEELRARGISDYDFETCMEDYRCGILATLQRLIMGGDQMDFQNERGHELLARWIERLSARVEHLPVEGLGAQ